MFIPMLKVMGLLLMTGQGSGLDRLGSWQDLEVDAIRAEL